MRPKSGHYSSAVRCTHGLCYISVLKNNALAGKLIKVGRMDFMIAEAAIVSARCSSVQMNKRLGFFFLGRSDFRDVVVLEIPDGEHAPVTSEAVPKAATFANSRRLSFGFMGHFLFVLPLML